MYEGFFKCNIMRLAYLGYTFLAVCAALCCETFFNDSKAFFKDARSSRGYHLTSNLGGVVNVGISFTKGRNHKTMPS